jgi:hypothetical protein
VGVEEYASERTFLVSCIQISPSFFRTIIFTRFGIHLSVFTFVLHMCTRTSGTRPSPVDGLPSSTERSFQIAVFVPCYNALKDDKAFDEFSNFGHRHQHAIFYFMFCGPCILIFFAMKTNYMHYLSSIYFVNQPLHVSGMVIALHQEVFTVYIQQLVRVISLD